MASSEIGISRSVVMPGKSSEVGFCQSAWRRYWPKGFLVSGVNGFFLLLLSIGSADKLHRSANALQPFLSVLVALVCGVVVSLLIIFVSMFNMRSGWRKTSAVLIVLIVCGYPYFNFMQNTYSRRIDSRVERAEASSKVVHHLSSLYEVEGVGLNVDEYREVVKSSSLPDVPNSAENISFSSVQEESFWGGRMFDLFYEVPFEVSHDASPSFEHEGYRGEVRTETDGNKLKVSFQGFIP